MVLQQFLHSFIKVNSFPFYSCYPCGHLAANTFRKSAPLQAYIATYHCIVVVLLERLNLLQQLLCRAIDKIAFFRLPQGENVVHNALLCILGHIHTYIYRKNKKKTKKTTISVAQTCTAQQFIGFSNTGFILSYLLTIFS